MPPPPPPPLQSGTYGDIYNFPQKQYEAALQQVRAQRREGGVSGVASRAARQQCKGNCTSLVAPLPAARACTCAPSLPLVPKIAPPALTHPFPAARLLRPLFATRRR